MKLYLRMYWRIVCGVIFLQLVITIAAVFGNRLWSAIDDLSSAPISRFLFYLVPTLILQVGYAIHLGLAYNLRAPEAWSSRLPSARAGRIDTPVGLLAIYAGLLVFPILKVWRFSTEVTISPTTWLVFALPVLVFATVRLVRDRLTAVAVGAVAGMVLVLVPFLCLEMVRPTITWHLGYVTVPCELGFLGFGLLCLAALESLPRFRRLYGVAAVFLLGMGIALTGQYFAFLNKDTVVQKFRQFETQRRVEEKQCDSYRVSLAKFVKTDPIDITKAKHLLASMPDFISNQADYQSFIESVTPQSPMAWLIRASFITGECLIGTYIYQLLKLIIAEERLANDAQTWSLIRRWVKQSTLLYSNLLWKQSTIKHWLEKRPQYAEFLRKLEEIGSDIDRDLQVLRALRRDEDGICYTVPSPGRKRQEACLANGLEEVRKSYLHHARLVRLVDEIDISLLKTTHQSTK